MFTHLNERGVVVDGRVEEVDAVLWCTGFRPALRHLRGSDLRGPDGHAPDLRRVAGHPAVVDNHLVGDPGVLFLGYGDWTGAASATLVGVGRTARELFGSRRRDGLRPGP